jgi:xanthine dehydrogenase accessory factor
VTNDLKALARALDDRDEDYALVTVVRALAPTSAYVGAQAIVHTNGTLHGWIGGGCARSVVVSAAQNAIESGKPKLVRISNEEVHFEEDVEQYSMACASNGSIELFIQPRSARGMLCVLGDSPAANEARFLAERLGIRLTDDAAGAPVVLVATQGQGDEEALETALRGSARHVLMIASRRKAENLRAVMSTRGLDESQLARLQAPAGPDAGAKAPAEVALVAVAGVLALLRGRGEPRESDDALEHQLTREIARGARADSGAAERASPVEERFINPVCGTTVSTAHPAHVESFEGESYYFCCDGCWTEFLRDPRKYAALRAAASSRA